MGKLEKFKTKEYRKYIRERQNLNKPLYYTWENMKKRCYNKNTKDYSRYGGRGISVCKEWKNDYKQFEVDMGDKPSGYTLDRIDNDGNYEKSNCRWATMETQALNRNFVINAKGYYLVENGNFRAKITINGKIRSKNFKTENEAKAWYEENKARIEV